MMQESLQESLMHTYSLDCYSTLVAMVGVLLLGRLLLSRVKFLRDFALPEPVVGGVVACVAIFLAYRYCSVHITFDEALKDPLMLAFFASIGLGADLSAIKKGGKLLVPFLLVSIGLLIVQNALGIGLALAMGVSPLAGMLGGSITMSGGHGTGLAWSDVFAAAPYLLSNAKEIALAAATFGLVAGGLIGTPVARLLIKRHGLKPPAKPHTSTQDTATPLSTPASSGRPPPSARLITPQSLLESIALIAICLLMGSFLAQQGAPLLAELGIRFPTFVWCLLCGIILRNTLAALKLYHVFDREISILGSTSLALFLALSFLIIKIWVLADIALPLIAILVAQTAVMVLYAIFVTFRFLGRDYDASVFAAGHCGFGLGATPTAMINMQAITSRYGPSHSAFVIVPLIGTFYITNHLVIQGFLLLKIFPQGGTGAESSIAASSAHTLAVLIDPLLRLHFC